MNICSVLRSFCVVPASSQVIWKIIMMIKMMERERERETLCLLFLSFSNMICFFYFHTLAPYEVFTKMMFRKYVTVWKAYSLDDITESHPINHFEKFLWKYFHHKYVTV